MSQEQNGSHQVHDRKDPLGTIGAVVVTYNRLEDLRDVLAAYDAMERHPAFLVVVDNASEAPTSDFLASWELAPAKYRKVVVTLSRNTGGAGGFQTGINRAIEEGADWVFVGDDDAVPASDVFQHLAEGYTLVLQDCPGENIAALCTMVMHNGKIDLEHRRRVHRGPFLVKREWIQEDEYGKPFFYLDEFSYVGTLISADAIRSVGSTRGDFFIYYDDSDHSLRLRGYGRIACVPSAVMDHRAKAKAANVAASWRDYYAARNRLLTTADVYGRWYLICEAFNMWLRRCSTLARVIKHHSPEYMYAARRGIEDALHYRSGISDEFAPGKPIEIE